MYICTSNDTWIQIIHKLPGNYQVVRRQSTNRRDAILITIISLSPQKSEIFEVAKSTRGEKSEEVTFHTFTPVRQRLIKSPEYISAAERPGRARSANASERVEKRVYARDRLHRLRRASRSFRLSAKRSFVRDHRLTD